MPGSQVRLLFMGTPVYAVPVLEALCAAKGVQVVAVYTPPDRPRGRGRPTEMTPVKAFAMQRDLPVRQPNSLRQEQVQQELAEFRPDVIVVAAYGKLLPPAVLELPPHGSINLHPSLLPHYRGPSPVVTAILDAAVVTGVTLMLLDEGMDTGPVIAQRVHTLTGQETADSLTTTLFQLGGNMLLECLEPWLAGQIKAEPQDDAQATLTHKLERTDGEANWLATAVELERRRRAYDPWPGLFTSWEGKVLKLLDVVSLAGDADARVQPGLVVAVPSTETPVAVATGDGLLGLRNLQLEGRRAQSSADFLLGYPGLIGARLSG